MERKVVKIPEDDEPAEDPSKWMEIITDGFGDYYIRIATKDSISPLFRLRCPFIGGGRYEELFTVVQRLFASQTDVIPLPLKGDSNE